MLLSERNARRSQLLLAQRVQPVVVTTGLVRSRPLASADTGSALFLKQLELVAHAATPILLFLVGVALQNVRVHDVALLPALTAHLAVVGVVRL